jgi:hypothetical protein
MLLIFGKVGYNIKKLSLNVKVSLLKNKRSSSPGTCIDLNYMELTP